MAEPTSSNYPGSLDSSVTLGGDAVNLTQLTLDAGIDASVTTISVTESIGSINVPCYLLIETELIYTETTGSGDFTTCTRGAGGTSAAAHSNGATVYVVYAANLFNQLKRAIIAIETELGAAVSSSSATLVARLAQSLSGAGNVDFASSTELTISTGAVVPTQNWHTIDTESDAASDDLDTLTATNATDGFILFLRANNAARTVVIKHNTGNIVTTTAADLSLDETYKLAIGIYDATLAKWIVATIGGGSGGTSLANAEGQMKNGVINVSVSSNNLTVAIKTLAGADPSSGDPVKIVINGTERSITSALSVTANAATNWCNAGSSELATKLINYFVYLGYNSTDGVVLGFARIPHGRVYSDFNTTSTDEHYCKISTITYAASTDAYVNIGRFSATLSAGAGYTWSISGTGDVVNYPIFETDPLSWTPSPSASGSMTFTSVTINIAEYRISGRSFIFEVKATGTIGGVVSNSVILSLPFTARNASSSPPFAGFVNTDGNAVGGYCLYVSGAAYFRRYDFGNWTAGSRTATGSGQYMI